MIRLMDCYRITTYVPLDALETVIEALCESGFLNYGAYADVLWFSVPGTGQFRPLEGANPAIGTVGARERVAESRLEFSILKNEGALQAVLGVLAGAHPYEEPAIYVTLAQRPAGMTLEDNAR